MSKSRKNTEAKVPPLAPINKEPKPEPPPRPRVQNVVLLPQEGQLILDACDQLLLAAGRMRGVIVQAVRRGRQEV